MNYTIIKYLDMAEATEHTSMIMRSAYADTTGYLKAVIKKVAQIANDGYVILSVAEYYPEV